MIKGGSGTSSEKARRLLRGGSWSRLPRYYRSAPNDHFLPDYADGPQAPSLNA
jgi:formylglycine-generating enzyme required for sulfatase activity